MQRVALSGHGLRVTQQKQEHGIADVSSASKGTVELPSINGSVAAAIDN